jgi:hypothetical protein
MKTNTFNQVLASALLVSFSSCLTIFAMSQLENPSQTEMSSRSPASATKTCVLFYERAEHPDLLKYKRKFAGKKAVIIPGAQPEDLMKCVMSHNPREVVLIGRTHEGKGTGSEISYFTPKTQKEIDYSFNQLYRKVQAQHRKMISTKGFVPCQTGPQDLTRCQGLQKKEYSLRMKVRWLSQVREADPAFRMLFVYQEKKMSNNPFQDLAALMSTANINLKRIKIQSTNTRQILAAYPTLAEINKSRGIRIEARTNRSLLALKPAKKKLFKTAGLVQTLDVQ